MAGWHLSHRGASGLESQTVLLALRYYRAQNVAAAAADYIWDWQYVRPRKINMVG
jgi:hypothetical protein